MNEEAPKKRGPKPDRLVIEGDPEAALDRLLARKPPEDQMKMMEDSKPCAVCGAKMEPKIYIDRVTKQPTPEVWSCPNRNNGKHPNPDEFEPTGRFG